jgi:hypothetical protein
VAEAGEVANERETTGHGSHGRASRAHESRLFVSKRDPLEWTVGEILVILVAMSSLSRLPHLLLLFCVLGVPSFWFLASTCRFKLGSEYGSGPRVASRPIDPLSLSFPEDTCADHDLPRPSCVLRQAVRAGNPEAMRRLALLLNDTEGERLWKLAEDELRNRALDGDVASMTSLSAMLLEPPPPRIPSVDHFEMSDVVEGQEWAERVEEAKRSRAR